METKKYIIKSYDDVRALTNFVNYAGIVSLREANEFLKLRGLSKGRIESVLGIVRNNRKVFFNKDNTYITNREAIFGENYLMKHTQIEKVNWLYIHLSHIFNNANYKCKYPCKAFFFSDNSEKNISVFHIRKAREKEDANIIDVNFSTNSLIKKPIDAIVILDSEDSLFMFDIPKGIHLIAYCIFEKDNNTKNLMPVFYDRAGDILEVSDVEM